MKSIEERAEEIYKGNTIEEDAYKRGAEEQKAIDAIEQLKEEYVEEDIITIHLGTTVSQKKYDEMVNYIVECLNMRYPTLMQEVS